MKKPTSGLNPDGVYALTQVQKNKNIGTYHDLTKIILKAGYKLKEDRNGFKIYHPDGTPVMGHKGIITIPEDQHISKDIYLRIVNLLSHDAVKYMEK